MSASDVQSRGDHHDLTIPFSLVDERLGDDQDTEQHKSHRGQNLHKRHIREYRHATSKLGVVIEGFGPVWFAIPLSTGGLASILNGPFVYPAEWLVTIATILYVFELVLFFSFMAIMITRWIMYPHVAVRRAMSDPDELGAYAIPPICLLTLAALTASQVSYHSWGGHAFAIVAYVVWWIAILWVFVTLLVVFSVLFYTGNQSDRVVSPTLFMAPVGLATAGTEAGFITVYSEGMSARLAVPQLVVGYFAVGVAFFTATLIYGIFFHGLLSAGWPAGPKRAGLFILLGPAGQLSTALQLLGESANGYMRLAEYKPGSFRPPQYGTFWTQETASGLQTAGLLLALLLLGFSYLWFFIAFIGVIDAFIKRSAKYSLMWWGVVFPLVTFTTAMLELSHSMDSPTFRALTAALTVFITITYLVNWGFTLYGIFDGSLIIGPSHAESEDGLLKKYEDQKAEEARQHV